MARLSRALEQTRIVVEGGTSNLAFLRALLVRDDVKQGLVDIGLVDRLRVDPPVGAGIAMVAAAIDRFLNDGDGAKALTAIASRLERVFSFIEQVHPVFGSAKMSSQRREAEDGPYQSWMKSMDGNTALNEHREMSITRWMAFPLLRKVALDWSQLHRLRWYCRSR